MAVTQVLFVLFALPSGAHVAAATDQENFVASCNTQGHSLVQRARPILAQEVVSSDVPDQITFNAIVRDFTADHPDFQSFDGHATGLVEKRLGPDRKPVFKGGPVLSNRSNFDQWYRNVPGVNVNMSVTLSLERASHNTYVFDSSSFFPIDGRGWNDSAIALDGQPHNFYFTLELQSTFIYQGGEQFTFRGDDDVWVFINDELVIDLGGVHNPLEGTVDLDGLGLRRGSTVNFSFFFAERRCCGSNFRLETSIQFTPIWGTCMLWGDPHVSVFDRGAAQGKELAPIMGMYDSGDFWLVRSSLVSIQGRYGATPWTPPGLSSLLALAIGGPFLQNHTLVIEPMDEGGRVTWDGQQIVQSLPSEFFIQGFANVSYHGDDERRLVDKAQEHLPLRIVTAHLPKNVYVTVNRWARHLDAIIAMSQQPDMDGHCGNFNGDPRDDTKELIEARIGAPVPAVASLFGSPPQDQGAESSREWHLRDCKEELRAEAERLCRESDETAAPDVLEACIFDTCFAGKQYATEDGIIDRESHSS